MCHAGTLVASQSVTQEVAGLSPFTVMTNIFTGRNEVVAKVIFLHLFVILFTGGGVSASVHAGIPPSRADTPLGADTPWEQTPPLEADTPPEQTPPRSRHIPPEQTPPGADTPQSRHPLGTDTLLEQTPPWEQTPLPPGSRLQHTVNERPVRILLECILVVTEFSEDKLDCSS